MQLNQCPSRPNIGMGFWQDEVPVMKRQSRDETPEVHCSFCGKAASQVKRLVSGPKVYICDECVALCVDILSPSGGGKRGSKKRATRPAAGSTTPLPHTKQARNRARKLSEGLLEFRCNACGWQGLFGDFVLMPDRGMLCRSCSSQAHDAITLVRLIERVVTGLRTGDGSQGQGGSGRSAKTVRQQASGRGE